MEDSPAKKLNFEAVGKENAVQESPVVEDVELKRPQLDLAKTAEKPTTTASSSIKAMEAEEPILKANPHRFVMFPIRYHEVGSFIDSRHVESVFVNPIADAIRNHRSGKCTRRPRHRSGRRKRSTFPKIFMTGTID